MGLVGGKTRNIAWAAEQARKRDSSKTHHHQTKENRNGDKMKLSRNRKRVEGKKGGVERKIQIKQKKENKP